MRDTVISISLKILTKDREIASHADGVLAATLPVEDHPEIGDRYLVGAKMYEISSQRELASDAKRTTYPTFEVDESGVENAVDKLKE
jgi:hypothetical protein